MARLLGYDLSSGDSSLATPTAISASGVKLRFYWRARNETAIPINYTVFTHLLNPSGQVVAQHDGWPAAGAHPTTGWVRDEIIIDDHLLTFVVPDFQGMGQIEVGLYDQATGKRVPLPDGSDHLLLPTQVIIKK